MRFQNALEREVVGQTRAVHTLARTVTVAIAGLKRSDEPLGVYLFMGPSGTGKTHIARQSAKLLHGGMQHLAVADCTQLGSRQEWQSLGRQLAPYFRLADPEGREGVMGMAPMSILLIEHLEGVRAEFVRGLVAALEAGFLVLPDGKCGSLRGVLVLMTSNLCEGEIYGAERKEIGFSPSVDLEETERARIFQICAAAAEKQWGAGLLSRLDDLVVFHRLGEVQLQAILKRQLAELNEQLSDRGVSCSLESRAADFLLARCTPFVQHGAWYLVKVFRRFVVFPLADVVGSRRIAPGSAVRVELARGDRLSFRVHPPTAQAGAIAGVRSFPVSVEWNEDPHEIDSLVN